MKWIIENHWHIRTALEREAELGTANAPKKERLKIATHTAPGAIGRDFMIENAIKIEASFRYNGSDEKAFGGARMWPAIRLDIGFTEKQIKERDAFVEKLKKFIAENYPN